jgi:type 1 fimbriae regulatory protein FimB
MLRHSAGYALSNKGHDFRLLQDFMGPRSAAHVALYSDGQPTV